MLTFLFWNLSRKPLIESVVRLAHEHRVDVLVLAECKIPIAEMLIALSNAEDVTYYFPFSQCETISIYTRFPSEFVTPVKESSRYTIRRVKPPTSEEILLAATHMQSKLYQSESSQHYACSSFAREILAVEEGVQHQRTLVLGDFNMNPWEPGLVSAESLHGVMARHIVDEVKRTVQDKEYRYFYNPMWGHLGDRGNTPAGTFFYRRAEFVAYFWHMFDQVLLRPTLLPYFHEDSLQILTTDGTISLLSHRGVPDKEVTSDHLPILLRLNF